MVGAGQRQHGTAVVVELVIVVVLDDRDAFGAREREQRQPARGLQRDRAGILMVRRHVDGAERGAPRAGHRRDVDPVAINATGTTVAPAARNASHAGR